MQSTKQPSLTMSFIAQSSIRSATRNSASLKRGIIMASSRGQHTLPELPYAYDVSTGTNITLPLSQWYCVTCLSEAEIVGSR